MDGGTMAAVVSGCHCANEGSEDGREFWSDTNKLMQIVRNDGALTILHMSAWRIPQIRQAVGYDFRIFLRFYPEAHGFHWCQKDGKEYADFVYTWIMGNCPYILLDPNCCIVLANEQDLASEGWDGGASWERPKLTPYAVHFIWEWQAAAIRQWRTRTGDVACKVGAGFLAGGHEPVGMPPDWEYTTPEARAALDLADVAILHAYGASDLTGIYPDQGGYWAGLRHMRPIGYRENVQHDPPLPGGPDPGGFCSQYPTQTFALTEFGNGRHSDPTVTGAVLEQFHFAYNAYSLTGQCAGITPFLWDSGGEHGQQRINRNPDLVQGLITMDRLPAKWPPEETPVPEDPRIQQLLNQNALLTQAIKAFRTGQFTGAAGMDGIYVALTGHQIDYVPTYPPKA